MIRLCGTRFDAAIGSFGGDRERASAGMRVVAAARARRPSHARCPRRVAPRPAVHSWTTCLPTSILDETLAPLAVSASEQLPEPVSPSPSCPSAQGSHHYSACTSLFLTVKLLSGTAGARKEEKFVLETTKAAASHPLTVNISTGTRREG